MLLKLSIRAKVVQDLYKLGLFQYYLLSYLLALLAENVHPLCLAFSYSLFSNEIWTFALFLR